MKTSYELATEAASQLQGTCKSIPELGEEFEALLNDDAFCARLDELVFECEECGWWCEISEMSQNKEWTCEECAPEEDED